MVCLRLGHADPATAPADFVAQYAGRTSDAGYASLHPNSSFVAGLLEGREPQLGLFVAAPGNAHEANAPFYEAGSGELTIGYAPLHQS